MIKLSTFLVIATTMLSSIAFAEPALPNATPQMKSDKRPPTKHEKKRDVNGVGEPGAGSLKARATQPAGGK